MELVGLQRESQVDSGASLAIPCRNGVPVSRWKMEPLLLHPLTGTLTATMIAVLSPPLQFFVTIISYCHICEAL